MITIQFTKVFIKGSILEGLTAVDTLTAVNQESAKRYLSFLKQHTDQPVKACAGSNYTVKDVKVL